jgi:suppressor for copper-sensitivity B
MTRHPLPSARPRRLAAALGAVAIALLAAPAARARIAAPQQARLALAADRTAYEAGATAHLAARVTIVPGWHVNSHRPTFEYLIPTTLTLTLPAGWPAAALRYPPAALRKFAFEAQPLSVYDGEVAVLADLAVPRGAARGSFPVRAALFYQACNQNQCLPPATAEATLTLAVGPGGIATGAALPPKPPAHRHPPVGTSGLGLMLAVGLLGGLILNAMPCVLPVLSLKVFGLVRSAAGGRAEVVQSGLATAAGILTSFWLLAGLGVAARAAGAAVGWGVQFQRPGFVAFLAVVVVLFCLNLWGLFEIPLPQRLARLGAAGPREGIAGHFASGLFATLMATPCSAPFLGTAIGFALAQPAPLILAIFTAVGLGMALPYLLLAAFPGAARWLPRPGAWMDGVRGAMGFVLAASAVWLFYVLASELAPERVALVEILLLALALFVWLRHRRQQTAPAAGAGGFPRLALAGAAAAAVAAVLAAAAPELRMVPGGTAVRTAARPAGLIPWVSFDRGRAESLAAAGQLVFVDVTADWCFTCTVNERLLLDTPEVARAFREHSVVPMRADWTNRNDEIGAFLAEHGRYGIPFYLLYLPGGDTRVFGELPSKADLVEAVRASAANKIAENR